MLKTYQVLFVCFQRIRIPFLPFLFLFNHCLLMIFFSHPLFVAPPYSFGPRNHNASIVGRPRFKNSTLSIPVAEHLSRLRFFSPKISHKSTTQVSSLSPILNPSRVWAVREILTPNYKISVFTPWFIVASSFGCYVVMLIMKCTDSYFRVEDLHPTLLWCAIMPLFGVITF